MKAHAEAKAAQSPSRAQTAPVGDALAQKEQLRDALISAGIQPRLKIGAADDPLEREADAVAQRVMSAPEPSLPSPASGKGVAGEGKHAQTPQANLIQTKASAASTATTQASPQVESSLNSLNSGGAPLDTATRAFFEPRFGQDFSQVRIHTGGNAAQMNESLNAKAFTLGNDIAFAPNQYSANTSTGRELLGHELAHVVQQQNMNGGVGQAKLIQRNAIMPKSTGWGPPSPEEMALIRRMVEIRSKIDNEAEKMDPESKFKYWNYKDNKYGFMMQNEERNYLLDIRLFKSASIGDEEILQRHEESLRSALRTGPVLKAYTPTPKTPASQEKLENLENVYKSVKWVSKLNPLHPENTSGSINIGEAHNDGRKWIQELRPKESCSDNETQEGFFGSVNKRLCENKYINNKYTRAIENNWLTRTMQDKTFQIGRAGLHIANNLTLGSAAFIQETLHLNPIYILEKVIEVRILLEKARLGILTPEEIEQIHATKSLFNEFPGKVWEALTGDISDAWDKGDILEAGMLTAFEIISLLWTITDIMKGVKALRAGSKAISPLRGFKRISKDTYKAPDGTIIRIRRVADNIAEVTIDGKTQYFSIDSKAGLRPVEVEVFDPNKVITVEPHPSTSTQPGNIRNPEKPLTVERPHSGNAARPSTSTQPGNIRNPEKSLTVKPPPSAEKAIILRELPFPKTTLDVDLGTFFAREQLNRSPTARGLFAELNKISDLNIEFGTPGLGSRAMVADNISVIVIDIERLKNPPSLGGTYPLGNPQKNLEFSLTHEGDHILNHFKNIAPTVFAESFEKSINNFEKLLGNKINTFEDLERNFRKLYREHEGKAVLTEKIIASELKRPDPYSKGYSGPTIEKPYSELKDLPNAAEMIGKDIENFRDAFGNTYSHYWDDKFSSYIERFSPHSYLFWDLGAQGLEVGRLLKPKQIEFLKHQYNKGASIERVESGINKFENGLFTVKKGSSREIAEALEEIQSSIINPSIKNTNKQPSVEMRSGASNKNLMSSYGEPSHPNSTITSPFAIEEINSILGKNVANAVEYFPSLQILIERSLKNNNLKIAANVESSALTISSNNSRYQNSLRENVEQMNINRRNNIDKIKRLLPDKLPPKYEPETILDFFNNKAPLLPLFGLSHVTGHSKRYPFSILGNKSYRRYSLLDNTDHFFLLIKTQTGEIIAFYKSSGVNSKTPGMFYPFFGEGLVRSKYVNQVEQRLWKAADMFPELVIDPYASNPAITRLGGNDEYLGIAARLHILDNQGLLPTPGNNLIKDMDSLNLLLYKNDALMTEEAIRSLRDVIRSLGDVKKPKK